jgi:TPR repeat protein
LAPRTQDEAGRHEVAEHLRQAAEAELPTAIYLLAVLTEQGVGVTRDPAVAARLYGHAAERGQRSAQLRWGLALMEGRDVVQDLVLGESWLRRAALAGDPDAAALVGDLYVKNGRLPPNYTEAAGWYRRAAEAGHIAATRAFGSLYLTGAGVAADPDEAARWLRVSGEAGDPASQIDPANLVLDGAGSAEDSARVAHWFEQAAASGDLVAAFNLGLCLDKGVGVEPDAQQAAHWLRRAAGGAGGPIHVRPDAGRRARLDPGSGSGTRLGRPRGRRGPARSAGGARRNAGQRPRRPARHCGSPGTVREGRRRGSQRRDVRIGRALYAGGHDLPEDRTAAQRWFRAAAELGHGQAQLMLGRYLAEGVAGEPNPSEARSWFEQAAAQGIEEAQADLAARPGLTLQ